MPKNNVTRFINDYFCDESSKTLVTKDGYARLRTYLGRVSKGQSRIFTAPFAKGQSMAEVMQDWDEILVSIRDTWPTLYDFEKDLAKKVGPMSIQKPLSERFEDIAHYYWDILLPRQPIDSSAIQATISEFSGSSGLRLRSAKRTVELMKKSTNSGTPYFTKRRKVVQETLPCSSDAILARIPYVDSIINGKRWDSAATIGWRGQEGGPTKSDVKQRVVWMFPFSVNINELQVYQPLIEAFQKKLYVPAWVSMDAVDDRITSLFDTKDENDLIVCTDFSRFDQHFNDKLQSAAEEILSALLTKDAKSKEWIEYVFPIKYMIPLIWGTQPDQDVINTFAGYHGMASGSGGTNVDETLVHRSLQYEAAIRKGEKLNPNSQCLGDDGILSYPGITVEDVVEAYSSHGQECNPDKQYASSQDCIYLRRWHHRDYRMEGRCVGVYSTMRALGRLRYLERYMDPEFWDSRMVALRQLSILENCKYHPLREQFVDFCMKRDKYRLGLDIPGFMDNLTKLAIESIEHMPDFLGYTKTLQGEDASGISEWWVVKYLKSKA